MKIPPIFEFHKIYHTSIKSTISPEYIYPSILNNSIYCAWFESGYTGEKNKNGFSYLVVDPQFIIIRDTRNKKVRYIEPKINFEQEVEIDNFFNTLSEINIWQQSLKNRLGSDLQNFENFPFIAGFYGYFGYDLKFEIENLRSIHPSLGFADSILCFYTQSVCFDYSTSTYHFFSISDDYALCDTLRKSIDNNFIKKGSVSYVNKVQKLGKSSDFLLDEYKVSMDKEEYIRAFHKIKEAIYSGKVYQACLTARFEKSYSGNPLDDYLILRRTHNTPFSSYLNFNNLHILSFSVENFISLFGLQIKSSPVKGTVLRKKNMNDTDLKIFLTESRKEKAENCIIVDLIRNDLGKISVTGSVKVTKLLEVETYPTVHQLVSVISSNLKVGLNFADILKSMFPGGSMTGAPKIETMNLIEEVETCSRGIYSGAFGFLDFRGNLELNMAIRTAFVFGGNVSFHSGGGIVVDSILEMEWNELVGKSEFFLKYFGSNLTA